MRHKIFEVDYINHRRKFYAEYYVTKIKLKINT